MVISHRYRFIFVKTAKTAGTSIEVFLSGVCGEQDVLTPIEPPVPPHRARNYEEQGFFNHMSAARIRERVDPSVWDGYLKFCVERNPWDKTLSHYHMERFRSEGELTLEEYFARGMAISSFGLYTDGRGELLVDRVLRYEDLNVDLADVFGALGVPFTGDIGLLAKSEYRTDRRHYREVLTDEQRDIVAEKAAREIGLFDYRY